MKALNSPYLASLLGKRKCQCQPCDGKSASIFKSSKSPAVRKKNDVSVLTYPIWRALRNDLISHLLENIAYSWALTLQFSLKTKRMKKLLASIGSPCLWPFLQLYLCTVSFQIIMYVSKQFNKEGSRKSVTTA